MGESLLGAATRLGRTAQSRAAAVARANARGDPKACAGRMPVASRRHARDACAGGSKGRRRCAVQTAAVGGAYAFIVAWRRFGVMMEATNAGKRRKLILKTFITVPPGSKMVLKTTRGMRVGKVKLPREQGSSLEGVEMVVILNLLPLLLEQIGTLLGCWVLMAPDLLLNRPSIRQVEITLSTWLATLSTP